MWGSVADNETGVSNKVRSEKQNHPATPIKNQTPNQELGALPLSYTSLPLFSEQSVSLSLYLCLQNTEIIEKTQPWTILSGHGETDWCTYIYYVCVSLCVCVCVRT